MPVPIPITETRTYEELHEQYEVERELASRLKAATQEERRGLYGWAYDEFKRRFPHATADTDPASVQFRVLLQMQLLQRFLEPASTFLEIGADDCALSIHLARQDYRVFALDTAFRIGDNSELPANFQLIPANTPPYEMASESIDVVYSCHMIEHLHPDDVLDHLMEVRRLLVPGGCYVCVTPNRFYGPHDISKYFDDVARGLHLTEYSHGDLGRILLDSGFSHVEVLYGLNRPPSRCPIQPFLIAEKLLDTLPASLRARVIRWLSRRTEPPFRPLEQVIVKADK